MPEQKTNAELLAEYEICKKRGHQPSGYRTTGVPAADVCCWCGTRYWHETQLVEVDVPKEVD